MGHPSLCRQSSPIGRRRRHAHYSVARLERARDSSFPAGCLLGQEALIQNVTVSGITASKDIGLLTFAYQRFLPVLVTELFKSLVVLPQRPR